MGQTHPAVRIGMVAALCGIVLACTGGAALNADSREAAQQDLSRNFEQADRVAVEAFVGTLIVEVGGSGVAVEIDFPTPDVPISVREAGGQVLLTGDRAAFEAIRRGRAPWRRGRWGSSNRERFTAAMTDYPAVTLRVPRGSDLVIDGAALLVEIDDGLRRAELSGIAEGYGVVGDVGTASVVISGQGDLSIGAVAAAFEGRIAGSGDIDVALAGTVSLAIAGSGDLKVGQVQGTADVRIKGSGDVEMAAIGGSTVFRISGSGDIAAGAIAGGLEVVVAGSGDVDVGSVNGPLSVDIRGNGDVKIAGGASSATDIDIRGSGDVRFDGVARDPTVAVGGSGNVTIKEYEGRISVRGDGDVQIGDMTFRR